jgi:hypothetical protein
MDENVNRTVHVVGSPFGGRIDDLRTSLLEECLPESWEPKIRSPYGLAFNMTVLQVELG